MARRRTPMMNSLPEPVRRAFTVISPAQCPEELLWREVALRAVLDALGYTGSMDDPTAHNKIVRESRLWFRMNMDGYAEMVFDLGGIDFAPVCRCILESEAPYISPKK